LYNESKRFNYQHWFSILENNSSVNFLFVDDNSTDDIEYLHNLRKNFTNVHYLKLEKNFGKANAVRQGLLSATCNSTLNNDLIGYLDFDDSILDSEINRLITLFNNLLKTNDSLDALWGSRVKLNGRKIVRSNIRHFFSRILITLIGFNYPSLPYDSQCGFKLFLNDPYIRKSIQEPFFTRWFVDIELLIRLTKFKSKKLNIWEEPLLQWTETKSSNYSFLKSIRIPGELFFICKEIRKIRKY
jgi:glycosyltransferase involved in cell wall biosynthesis